MTSIKSSPSHFTYDVHAAGFNKLPIVTDNPSILDTKEDAVWRLLRSNAAAAAKSAYR